MSERRLTFLAILALLAAAVLPVAYTVATSPRWETDALFYEAKRLEIQGASRDEALDEVFSGPRARQMAEADENPLESRLLDPAWVDYSARFYQRRLAVPAAAAAVSPVFEDDSLPAAVLVGYLFLGPALFLLLRLRFSVTVSFVGALVCLAAPPVARWGTNVGVDGWGMTFQALSYVGLQLVLDRGYRWVPLWMTLMAILSITRDATVAVGLALGLVVLARFLKGTANGRHLAALVTGALAALPAPLLISAPLRENLAYVIDGASISSDTSWSYIFRNFPGQVWATQRANFERPLDFAPVVMVGAYVAFALVVLALVVLVVRSRRDDDYFALQQASLVSGAVFLLLSPNPQNFRLELIFLPAVAVAIALCVDLAIRRVKPGWSRAPALR